GSAVLAPQLAPWDPARQMLTKRLRPPMWQAHGLREHPLGTDHLGRDILNRILPGARISLGVGLTAVTLSALIGVPLALLARARGNRPLRLLLRHVLPNALTPIIVVATLELAFMIIYESALSFLGLGVQPPTPTWGWMLADGRNYVATAWWLATFPGLAIML